MQNILDVRLHFCSLEIYGQMCQKVLMHVYFSSLPSVLFLLEQYYEYLLGHFKYLCNAIIKLI